jgi:hypothetical protein
MLQAPQSDACGSAVRWRGSNGTSVRFVGCEAKQKPPLLASTASQTFVALDLRVGKWPSCLTAQHGCTQTDERPIRPNEEAGQLLGSVPGSAWCVWGLQVGRPVTVVRAVCFPNARQYHDGKLDDDSCVSGDVWGSNSRVQCRLSKIFATFTIHMYIS